MIVCILLPRFQFTVAAAAAGAGRDALLQKPVALAPEPGGSQVVGEVSLAAEAFGVHSGMRLGEALARCPRLTLLPGDPAGVADSWERLLVRLESIGAAVEPERPGLVCFDGRGLLRLHGGIEASAGCRPSRHAGPGPIWGRPLALCSGGGGKPGAGTPAGDRRRRTMPRGGGRSGAGIGRVADGHARARAFLAPLPVALLRARPALADLPEALERLGIRTLGELASLPPTAIADRFGAAGAACLRAGERWRRCAEAAARQRARARVARAPRGRVRHPARAGAGTAHRPCPRAARATRPDAALGRAVGGAGRAWRHVA